MAGVDTHYKFTIRLMTLLGLWPYVNNTSFRRIKSAVVNCICTSFVTAQITPLTTGNVDLTTLLQCLCFIVIFLGSVVKFNTFIVQFGTGYEIDVTPSPLDGSVFNNRNQAWATLACGTDVAASLLLLVAFMYASALLLVAFRTSSYFMVVTAAPNSNLTDPFPIMTEYLIDKEKYFFHIMIHQNLAIFFTATAFVATETLYIMWLQHSISLFELASYHIEKGVSERPAYISQEVMEVYRKKCLATAVTYHNEAKAFLTYLKSKFTFLYAVLIVIGVFSLAINFFRLSSALGVTHNVEEMLLASVMSVSELAYMFYVNYAMQKVVDYTDDLPTIIYSTPWYNRSVSIQKNLLIILTRCSDPILFDYYGFYTASIEGFSGLIRTTVSYFMMMTSLQ